VVESPAVPKKIEIVFHEVNDESEVKRPKLDPARCITALDTTMMPWLVPACSRDDLESTVARAGAGLFSGSDIAGIVPGANSPFDACAFGWANKAPLQWMFEFKSRSEYYEEADAIRHLNAKCATYRRKEEENGRSPEEHHAMLVGIAGTGPTQAHVWLEDTKLRIVLLVSSMAGVEELV
jgi:hypothetical protein